AEGVTRFLELGPDAVLTALGPDCLADDGDGDEDTDAAAAFFSVLRRDRGEERELVQALAQAYARGVTVDWSAFFSGRGARRVELPTYAFQRRRYWSDGEQPESSTTANADPLDAEFWDAVERTELSSLADRLRVDVDKLGAVLPAMSAWRTQYRDQSRIDSWRYRVDWQPLTGQAATGLTGTWLVVLPAERRDDAMVSAVLQALGGQGAQVVQVEVADEDRAELAERIRRHTRDTAPVGVLSLLALDDRPHPEHPMLTRGTEATVGLVQALADIGSAARLWCVTTGAVAVVSPGEVVHPLQAAIWGMGLGLSLDHPERWGGLVDLPADFADTGDATLAARLCGALAGREGEDQLALRRNGLFGRRLVRHALGGQRTEPQWRPRGTTLVTGGTGGIGAHVARWLASHGAEHLVLTSRRGADAPGAAELTAELRELGARVTVAACDVADRESVRKLLDSIELDSVGDKPGTSAPHPPLTSVFHAAGVAQRMAALPELTLGEFADVGRAKVAGALHLDELLGDRELDAFVLFSSGSAIWGSSGQTAYGSANAVLDALAQRRQAQGLAATSVAWGPWLSGMVDEETSMLARRIGAPAMDPELAIGALHQALDRGDRQLVVADFDWSRFAPTFTSARARPLLDALPDVQAVLAADGPGAADSADSAVKGDSVLRKRLAGATEAEQTRLLLGLVREQVAAVLGYDDPTEVEPGRAFSELGFDSVSAVDLRTGLSAATAKKLPTSMIFDHSTPKALAAYLRTVLCQDPEGGTTEERSFLAELGRLEETVAALPAEEIGPNRVTARLQTLLARVNEALGAAEGDEAAQSVGGQLEAASADDVFDFIDKELGLS
ncbi:SDR family NAD(P)-dependent oxidoreductase, partial [Streptomyces sp. E11-3]|uniref:SDR family NAD(P)-dependent oxidoreductase n=1 Tax=Streptomyces sp. E11-3 TaxID=3110112 RepID=UPI00397F3715